MIPLTAKCEESFAAGMMTADPQSRMKDIEGSCRLSPTPQRTGLDRKLLKKTLKRRDKDAGVSVPHLTASGWGGNAVSFKGLGSGVWPRSGEYMGDLNWTR